jgi:hypothetical protein
VKGIKANRVTPTATVDITEEEEEEEEEEDSVSFESFHQIVTPVQHNKRKNMGKRQRQDFSMKKTRQLKSLDEATLIASQSSLFNTPCKLF